MRIGTKKHPFYRIVAVDERHKRTGGYLELLGTYNPISKPKEIKLDQKKIDEWIKKGAQMSEGFLRIIGKAPKHPPKPPKKQKKEAAVEATPEAASTEVPKVQEVSTEEVKPQEEIAQESTQQEESKTTDKTEQS